MGHGTGAHPGAGEGSVLWGSMMVVLVVSGGCCDGRGGAGGVFMKVAVLRVLIMASWVAYLNPGVQCRVKGVHIGNWFLIWEDNLTPGCTGGTSEKPPMR